MIEEKLIPQCEIVLETLEDVFRVFQPSHEYWASYHTHAWVFRGHAIENWQLVPTIFRNDVRERFGLVSPDGIRLKPFVLSEIELLRDFTLFCDSVGLQIPEQAYSYIMNVNKFNANDDENSFNEFPPVELQHLLALAQHHGLPTRLLDFTYDPLTALFFAAFPPKGGTNKNDYMVVYGLNRFNINNFTNRYEEIHAPSYYNVNLQYQRGIFLVDTLAYESLEKKAFPPDMQTILDQKFAEKMERDKPILLQIDSDHYFYRKIKIPETFRLPILKILHQRHYDLAHILPSYNSVSEMIRILPHLRPTGFRKQNDQNAIL